MRTNPALTAKKLLENLGISDTASIELSDLIYYHNGIVQEVDLKNSDGRLVMKNGRSIISVDSKIEFPQRKRYVLAHELGHMLLHANREASFTDDDSTLEGYKKGPQEKDANDFAAELLTPSDLFKDSCNKRFSPDLLRELSDRFNTSLTSTVYRFVDLGNHPIAAFYSKNGKLQYWKKSVDMRYRISDITKLNVPSDSVANEYYANKKIYSRAESAQDINKSTWFELGQYDQESSMYEYCIVTPRFNSVLSVVWEN